MKRMDNAKRTRLKLVIYFGSVLVLLTAYAIFEGMDGPATLGITSIGALVAKYSHDETKRPSEKQKEELLPSNEEQP